MAEILLGCIADDFTGATDLANNLVRSGMRTVQVIGVPPGKLDAQTDAVVVALKSRTVAAHDAVAQSLQALQWLKQQHARQIYFKYCSTFDSTRQGNIGPVIEALMQTLQTDFTIATPAFPDNGRTVFKGHLFVGDVLLSESGMRDHPLTPMTDANLVRVLQAQCRRKVGLIDHKTVAQGAEAIRTRIGQLKAEGTSIAIVDAVSNDDLMRLCRAVTDQPLVTASSGVAIGLPGNFGLKPSLAASALPAAKGLQAVVSGSCSQATNRQVAHFIAQGQPALALDLRGIVRDGVDAVTARALHWAVPQLKGGPLLIYSTTAPDAVKAVQAEVGVARASEMIEHTLAAVARGLVRVGVRQLVAAGGETSGACVQALGVAQLQIGPQIDPGVPWCHASTGVDGAEVHLALKSGNFGGDDLFTRAFRSL
jgi:uncharacterized protein YgbK (DUF1537 family)